MSQLNQSIGYLRRRLKPYIQNIDEYISAEDQLQYFRVIKKKKRRGGHRYIYVCTDPKLRSAHKVIYEMLRDYQGLVLPCAHGFIKGKSTYTNAKNHTGQTYTLHLDIKDFFDSILIEQVQTALTRLGMENDVVQMVSNLCTVNGVMRQGLHTSPDLANHCLYNIDAELTSYVTLHDMRYSRYGDDITISSTLPPNITELRSIIEVDGFRINENKIKLQKRGSNQYVTGLTVFDSEPRIPRNFKKRLRLYLYYIERYGFEEHVKRSRGISRDDFETDEEYEHVLAGMLHGTAKYIIGHVSYVNSVEPEKAKPMWAIINRHNLGDYI